MLEVNRYMAEALRTNDINNFARAALKSASYRPISESAHEYAAEGITSLAEVMRVSALVEDEAILGKTPFASNADSGE